MREFTREKRLRTRSVAGTLALGEMMTELLTAPKLVVLRGSVPTEAQKQKAGRIAQDHAKSYRIDNQLAVVSK